MKKYWLACIQKRPGSDYHGCAVSAPAPALRPGCATPTNFNTVALLLGDEAQQRVRRRHAGCMPHDLDQQPRGLSPPKGAQGDGSTALQRTRTSCARSVGPPRTVAKSLFINAMLASPMTPSKCGGSMDAGRRCSPQHSTESTVRRWLRRDPNAFFRAATARVPHGWRPSGACFGWP